MRVLGLLLCVILLSTPLISALAISPGRTAFHYKQGNPLEGSFSLNSDRSVNIGLSVQGPLEPYLALEKTKVSLAAGEWKEIKYTITLPEVLPTDKLDSLIIADDLSTVPVQGGTFIAARVAVATRVAIQFDAPVTVAKEGTGEKTEGMLDVQYTPLTSVAGGELVDINIELANSGDSPLEEVAAELIVYDINNNEVMRSRSGAYTISGKSTAKARIGLDAAQLAPGTYKAKLIVSSGNKVIEREFTFTTTEQHTRTTTNEAYTSSRVNIALIIGAVLALIVIDIVIWLLFRSRRRQSL